MTLPVGPADEKTLNIAHFFLPTHRRCSRDQSAAHCSPSADAISVLELSSDDDALLGAPHVPVNKSETSPDSSKADVTASAPDGREPTTHRSEPQRSQCLLGLLLYSAVWDEVKLFREWLVTKPLTAVARGRCPAKGGPRRHVGRKQARRSSLSDLWRLAALSRCHSVPECLRVRARVRPPRHRALTHSV